MDGRNVMCVIRLSITRKVLYIRIVVVVQSTFHVVNVRKNSDL